MAYTEPEQLAGCGNYVAVYRRRRSVRGTSDAVCDLFRLDHGHIVEHWDAIQPITDVI
jgi:predicted SnoaL-like aldol condensation-catalyzing enzyme